MVDRKSKKRESAPVAVGRALRRLRGRTTQAEIALALGTTQATVSRWESDTDGSIPNFDEMRAIETHLGLGRGAILVAAGLVEVDGLEAAVLADPHLERTERELVLNLYTIARNRSQHRRKL